MDKWSNEWGVFEQKINELLERYEVDPAAFGVDADYIGRLVMLGVLRKNFRKYLLGGIHVGDPGLKKIFSNNAFNFLVDIKPYTYPCKLVVVRNHMSQKKVRRFWIIIALSLLLILLIDAIAISLE